MERMYFDDDIQVLNKELKVINTGLAYRMVDWICNNPLGPDTVVIIDTGDRISIDEFMTEMELLRRYS